MSEGESSIRDEIELAWESHESGDTVAKDAPSIPELDSPESVTTPTKFDDEPAKEPAAAVEAKPEKRGPGRPKKSEQVTPAIDPTPTPSIEAPRSWRADERENFKQLPPALQETISRREIERERAFTQRMEETSRAQRRYAQLDEVLAPHEEKWGMAGVEPAQVIKQFLHWQNALDRDPATALSQLAQSYGLDVGSLGQQAPKIDPEIQRLRQELEQVQGSMSQREQYAQQQYQTQLEQGIEAYATEKGADGRPARPYFEDVWADMTSIVKDLVRDQPHLTHRQVLDQAYDRATWANPTVRERVLAEHEKSKEAKRMAEGNARAQKAKAAAVSVRGSPVGSSIATSSSNSIRESLESAWDSLT